MISFKPYTNLARLKSRSSPDTNSSLPAVKSSTLSEKREATGDQTVKGLEHCFGK